MGFEKFGCQIGVPCLDRKMTLRKIQMDLQVALIPEFVFKKPNKDMPQIDLDVQNFQRSQSSITQSTLSLPL